MSERICGICQETCDHSQAIKADREMLAGLVRGLHKYDEDFENGYPPYRNPGGYWVAYHEVLALLEKELG